MNQPTKPDNGLCYCQPCIDARNGGPPVREFHVPHLASGLMGHAHLDKIERQPKDARVCGAAESVEEMIERIETTSPVLALQPDGSYRETGETVRQFEDRLKRDTKRAIAGPHAEGDSKSVFDMLMDDLGQAQHDLHVARIIAITLGIVAFLLCLAVSALIYRSHP